ncbi:MAG: hypothetical protein L6408_01895 [Nanoarchaeota archaeon]|nr:hypothetical protein [Nanoarchaeota archaeon]
MKIKLMGILVLFMVLVTIAYAYEERDAAVDIKDAVKDYINNAPNARYSKVEIKSMIIGYLSKDYSAVNNLATYGSVNIGTTGGGTSNPDPNTATPIRRPANYLDCDGIAHGECNNINETICLEGVWVNEPRLCCKPLQLGRHITGMVVMPIDPNPEIISYFPKWTDTDGNYSNGCECYRTDSVELGSSLCNDAIDNDCDGDVDGDDISCSLSISCQNSPPCANATITGTDSNGCAIWVCPEDPIITYWTGECTGTDPICSTITNATECESAGCVYEISI